MASYWQEVITSPSIRSKNGKTKLVRWKNRRVGAGDGEWSGRWRWGWGGVG